MRESEVEAAMPFMTSPEEPHIAIAYWIQRSAINSIQCGRGCDTSMWIPGVRGHWSILESGCHRSLGDHTSTQKKKKGEGRNEILNQH